MPPPPAAYFKSLPPHQILTLNFDAPEMWLVEPVVAEHDLDNLKLEQLGDSATLNAEYELEALMLTGRCMDLHAKRRELVRDYRRIYIAFFPAKEAAAGVNITTQVLSSLILICMS